jgi:hypothetical protein
MTDRPKSFEELFERRKADRLVRLMDLQEATVRDAERRNEILRDGYAREYRALVGVFPDQRHELRARLLNLQGVTVEELLASFR